MPCKHADNMMLYAKQAAECDEPWKLWKGEDSHGNVFDLQTHPQWLNDYEYRQIPKTININGHEVPEPMREKPELGTEYYFITSSEKDGTRKDIWCGADDDINRMNNGVCHLTRDNCIAHAKALFSFSEVG